MEDLVSRYVDAVTRYIHLKLRDKHLADEVLQDFWTKLLSGKLAGADRTKGRFRDYLRTVLHRLIIDHYRTRKLQSLPPGDLLDASQPDADFDRVWRDAVLKRVMSRLLTYQAATPKNRYASVLELRGDFPDATIDELAERLSQSAGTPMSPEAFRKNLQRARSKFVELLILELKETIHPTSNEDVEAEIYDLGLGYLYRRYMNPAEN
jgi:RNA polymerase sigma-70 factor (ECF subfamily)